MISRDGGRGYVVGEFGVGWALLNLFSPSRRVLDVDHVAEDSRDVRSSSLGIGTSGCVSSGLDDAQCAHSLTIAIDACMLRRGAVGAATDGACEVVLCHHGSRACCCCFRAERFLVGVHSLLLTLDYSLVLQGLFSLHRTV